MGGKNWWDLQDSVPSAHGSDQNKSKEKKINISAYCTRIFLLKYY